MKPSTDTTRLLWLAVALLATYSIGLTAYLYGRVWGLHDRTETLAAHIGGVGRGKRPELL